MQPVRWAGVVLHGATLNMDEAVARLRAVADEAGVELVEAGEGGEEIAVSLGGDGTILRALPP